MRNPVSRSRASALLASVLIFAATSAMAAEKVFDRSFSVKPTGTLTVNADGARIDIVGGDADQVIVHMVARASQRELDDLNFSATQSESGVDVEMLHTERRSWFDWGTWVTDARIEVQVPRAYRIDAKTSGGDIRLATVSGSARLRTSGGGIDVKNVKGGVEANTSGGGIRLESIEGLVRAHTSGGGIHADDVRGDIDAGTSGGDVRLLHIDGKVRANTSGGGVQCEIVGANRGISATTSGGGIRLTMPRNISGTLDARTSGGTITTDLPVTTTHVGSHELNGEINGGGEAIFARTSGGGIRLSATE